MAIPSNADKKRPAFVMVPKSLIGTAARPCAWFRGVSGHVLKVLIWIMGQFADEHGHIRLTLSQISKGVGGNRGTNSRAVQSLITGKMIDLVERGRPGAPSVYKLRSCCAGATRMVAPENQDGCARGTDLVAPIDPICCAARPPIKTLLNTTLNTTTTTSDGSAVPPAASNALALRSRVVAGLARLGFKGKRGEQLIDEHGLDPLADAIDTVQRMNDLGNARSPKRLFKSFLKDIDGVGTEGLEGWRSENGETAVVCPWLRPGDPGYEQTLINSRIPTPTPVPAVPTAPALPAKTVRF